MVVKPTYDLLKVLLLCVVTRLMLTLLAFKELLSKKAKERVYVATSNADGLVHRNGHFDFDTQVTELQGTYSLLQCLTPCRCEVLDAITTILVHPKYS
jgi:hypothetical protein